MKFVANNSSKVYHTEECHCVSQMLKENMSISESRPLYFRPCSKCRPEVEAMTLNSTIDSVEVQQ